MKKVQGGSFSVRFTRRGVAVKPSVKPDAVVQDNVYAEPKPSTPTESPQAMTEAFEKIQRDPLHPHQEHTSPRETMAAKPVAAPASGLKEKALWHAAKNGDCYAIRLLVMDGVDIDARDAQGRTAINIATQYNQRDALKTLLAGKEMRRMAKLGELPNSVFFDKFKKLVKTGTE
jgi:hypothetical protein